eukprot:1178959-Prorocentrum_minimum.AAC.1
MGLAKMSDSPFEEGNVLITKKNERSMSMFNSFLEVFRVERRNAQLQLMLLLPGEGGVWLDHLGRRSNASLWDLSTNSFTGVHSPDSIEYDLKLTTSPAGAGRVSFFKRKRQKARSATPNVCKRVENTGERVAGSQQLRVTCRWGVPGGTTSSRLVSSPAHCAGDGRSVKRPIAALEMQRVKATYGTRRRV